MELFIPIISSLV